MCPMLQVGATESARGCAGSTIPPNMGVSPPHHPSSVAPGGFQGSGSLAPEFNHGFSSTELAPFSLHQLGYFTVISIPEVGRNAASSAAHGADTLQSSQEQLGGRGLPPTSQENRGGRRAGAFPRGKHQRKSPLNLLLLFHKGKEQKKGIKQ